MIISAACSAIAYTVAAKYVQLSFRDDYLLDIVGVLTLRMCCDLQRRDAEIDDTDVLCSIHAQVRVHDSIHLPREHAQSARCVLGLSSDNKQSMAMEGEHVRNVVQRLSLTWFLKSSSVLHSGPGMVSFTE